MISIARVRQGMAYAIILLSVMVPTFFGKLGDVSLSATFSVMVAVCSIVILMLHSRIDRGLRMVALFFFFFIFWILASLMWSGLSRQGLQNIVVLSGFPLAIIVLSKLEPSGLRGLNVLFSIAALGAAGLYLLITMSEGMGSKTVMMARPFAVMSTVYLAWIAPSIRYEERIRSRVLSSVVALALLSAILAALSRTALMIGVFIILFSLLVGKNAKQIPIRAVLILFLVVGGFVSLVSVTPAMRDRFQGNDTYVLGGATVNFTGRSHLWGGTISSWSESPGTVFFGKGAGSVGPALQMFRKEPHPHNEYLRLLHDYGVIGLVSWVGGYASLGVILLRRYFRVSKDVDHMKIRYMISAINAYVAVGVSAMFDNPLIYVFVVAPAAVLIGCGLASSTSRGRVEEQLVTAGGDE